MVKLDTRPLLKVGRSMYVSAFTVAAKAELVVRKTTFDIEKDAKNLVHVDTGATKNSIGCDFTGAGTGLFTGICGPTTEYAPFLEDGTSRMPAYPFMGPSFDRRFPRAEKAIANLAGTSL